MLNPELESAVAAAEAAGLKHSNDNVAVVVPEDEVVGIVSNPRLLALLALFCRGCEEFKTRWPFAVSDLAELTIASSKSDELDALKTEFWEAACKEFGIDDGDGSDLDVKQNEAGDLVVVKVKNAAPETAEESLEGSLLEAFLLDDDGGSMGPSPEKCAKCAEKDCSHRLAEYVPASQAEMQ